MFFSLCFYFSFLSYLLVLFYSYFLFFRLIIFFFLSSAMHHPSFSCHFTILPLFIIFTLYFSWYLASRFLLCNLSLFPLHFYHFFLSFIFPYFLSLIFFDSFYKVSHFSLKSPVHLHFITFLPVDKLFDLRLKINLSISISTAQPLTLGSSPLTLSGHSLDQLSTSPHKYPGGWPSKRTSNSALSLFIWSHLSFDCF